MTVSGDFETPSKAPIVSLSKKVYLHCLVLVGSRNGFECDKYKPKLFVSNFFKIDNYT